MLSVYRGGGLPPSPPITFVFRTVRRPAETGSTGRSRSARFDPISPVRGWFSGFSFVERRAGALAKTETAVRYIRPADLSSKRSSMATEPETSTDEHGITEDDLAVIEQYLRKPSYERNADDLLPSSES